MALIKCSECGKEISEKATSCPHCGAPVEHTEPSNEYHGMVCPKCGSKNVVVQKMQTGSIGAAQNSVTIQEPKRKKGLMYWLNGRWLFDLSYAVFVGWWWGLIHPKPKYKKGINLNASKTLNKTVAVCQDCGHSWNPNQVQIKKGGCLKIALAAFAIILVLGIIGAVADSLSSEGDNTVKETKQSVIDVRICEDITDFSFEKFLWFFT